MKNGTQASVHGVLQGKGGVGKSFVSAILAQYFRTKSAPVYCLDTDPVNATFAQYRVLEAEHLKVLRHGTVNEKQFDVLVEKVCHGDGLYIVDTGGQAMSDTLKVPAGSKFTVRVNRDILFEAPYEPMGANPLPVEPSGQLSRRGSASTTGYAPNQ
jgi:cellulose biosynthesis protein BcsQ